MTPIEIYIRQAAIKRGIDPDVAVTVARSEGGLDNPVQQSNVVKGGVREESYGPFQLKMKGGLGEEAMAAGIDPRDPNQWQRGVDFALDHAAKSGWGQWYGAKHVGLANNAGLNRAYPAGISLTSAPGAGISAPALPATTPALTIGAGISAPAFPGAAAPPAAATPPPSGIQQALGEGGPLASIAKALGGGSGGGDPSLNQIAPSSIGTNDNTISQQAAMLMDSVLNQRRKRHGLSLTGQG